jgi:hypothetical protein
MITLLPNLPPFPAQSAAVAQVAKSARAPHLPLAAPAHLLFWPSAAHPRGRPVVVADGRAPPVIPDLESETDRGAEPDPEPDFPARA